MTDEAHKHPNYLLVMVVLAVMTAIEVAVAMFQGESGSASWIMIALVLLALALAKAACVGLFFMHLISERTAFIVIVSAPLVLGVVMLIGLTPDHVFR